MGGMASRKQLEKTSKFLSLVLRHKPETIGIKLDPEGWVDVTTLILACEKHGQSISAQLLDQVVKTSDKKRFVVRAGRIRANQGHSVAVDLALPAAEPPLHLFHGTADRFLDAIRQDGLKRMQRQHVHLSPDVATAHRVGIRHGKPVILRIGAQAMHASGHVFYCSDNGVWLTEKVPIQFIEQIDGP